MMSRTAISPAQSATRLRVHKYEPSSWKGRIVIFTKFLVTTLLLPFLLSACALEGDFGRPKASIFDRIADELLPSETTLLGSRGGSGVTDDEMAMRESGHHLASPLAPPKPPAAGPSGGYGGARSHYYKLPNPLAGIEENLQIDHQVLTHFGQSARRVLITDSRRMQAIYDHDPNILVEDKRSARTRMKENYTFIEQTFEDLDRRFRTYNYALDKIKISKPNLTTVEMDGSLNHLRDRTASLKYELTRYFGTAVARRGDYRPPRFASREYNEPNYGRRQVPYPAPGSYQNTPQSLKPPTSIR